MKHTIASTVLALGFALGAGSAFAMDGGDAAAGEKVFKKCQSCHMVGADAKNKVGPVLTGIIGRQAGSLESFGKKYGKDLVAAGEAGLVWNEEEIFAYLEDPRKYLRAKLDNKKAKSKMAFKLRKEDDRKNVIAYLATFTEGAAEKSE